MSESIPDAENTMVKRHTNKSKPSQRYRNGGLSFMHITLAAIFIGVAYWVLSPSAMDELQAHYVTYTQQPSKDNDETLLSLLEEHRDIGVGLGLFTTDLEEQAYRSIARQLFATFILARQWPQIDRLDNLFFHSRFAVDSSVAMDLVDEWVPNQHVQQEVFERLIIDKQFYHAYAYAFASRDSRSHQHFAGEIRTLLKAFGCQADYEVWGALYGYTSDIYYLHIEPDCSLLLYQAPSPSAQ